VICGLCGIVAFALYVLAIFVTFRELSNPKPREGRVMVAFVVLIASGLAVGSYMASGGQ